MYTPRAHRRSARESAPEWGADARRREKKPRPKKRLSTAAERHEVGGADEPKSDPDRCRKHSIVTPDKELPGDEEQSGDEPRREL